MFISSLFCDFTQLTTIIPRCVSTQKNEGFIFSSAEARSHINLFLRGAVAHSGTGPPHYGGFTMTLRHTTLGRTPRDE